MKQETSKHYVHKDSITLGGTTFPYYTYSKPMIRHLLNDLTLYSCHKFKGWVQSRGFEPVSATDYNLFLHDNKRKEHSHGLQIDRQNYIISYDALNEYLNEVL